MPETEDVKQSGYDYIIVGSGAGGAPLAARLVLAGKRVLVIEAGSNHTTQGSQDPGNEVSRVPLLHSRSTEHPDLSWRFFVEHYQKQKNGELVDGIPEDDKRHKSSDKTQDGIFYPRASGIGGCTIHNAMITIAGPDSDWDDLANFLGDPSWNSRSMRHYFQRMEHNDYLPTPKSSRVSVISSVWRYGVSSLKYLFGFVPDTTSGRHGFTGWLHTSFTDLSIGLGDRQIVKMIKAALKASKYAGLDNSWTWVRTILKGRVTQSLDPNHAETQANSPEGITLIPLSIYGGRTSIHQNRSTPYAMLGRRSSPREFLMETLALHPDKLTILTDCLVTKVIFKRTGQKPKQDSKTDNKDAKPESLSEGDWQAEGVEYFRGKNLYRASVDVNNTKPETCSVKVKDGGEVILCGGSFNTPQLLMLSGVGDHSELGSLPTTGGQKIDLIKNLPGVGKNLQDRYEVSIVSQMKEDFSLLKSATFDIPSDPKSPDPHLRQWREEGTGLYTSNGGVVGLFKRSSPELTKPDLFIFGVPAEFRGYEVGYSKIREHNLFTWIILKSHTRNREGYVRLRTLDPRDTPEINFNYFGTAIPGRPFHSSSDPDVKALVHGVGFVREILKHANSVVQNETHPANDAMNDSDINKWIRQEAWGHHACGTCRMGPDSDVDAVLDSRFRVRGVKNLRVVDASVFPKIPGYFIVTNIYMASEKAADVILEDAKNAKTNSLAQSIYPDDLRSMEAQAIRKRREIGALTEEEIATKASPSRSAKIDLAHEASKQESDQHCPLDKDDSNHWKDNVTGLALSGGGIRSATIGLGFLQSLARGKSLRKFDFLSTVSGGGYIGSFLGRFYDRLRITPGDGNLRTDPPADHVERALQDSSSQPVSWLRSHGNYLSPTGKGDNRTNFAIYVRNLLSLHVVIGVALIAIFGVANFIRYGVFAKLLATSSFIVHRTNLPLGHLLESVLGPWFSPWFILVEVILLFLVIPRIIGYWITSATKHESFKTIPLLLMFASASLLLWMSVRSVFKLDLALLGVSLLSSLLHIELVWYRGKQREAAVGSGGEATQRLRSRNFLTYDLGLSLALAGVALVFTLIDTVGHGLQQWKLSGNQTYATAFGTLGAAIVGLVPVIRFLAGYFKDSKKGPPSTLARIFKGEAMACFLAIVLFTLPLITYSFAAHAIYQGGTAVFYGTLVTLGAIGVTILLALPSAVPFINSSSLAQTYAARLARAYLGASNPARARQDGMNVTEVIPGDDVASIRNYRPFEGSGPLHLINVSLNQTVDEKSLQSKRDRQGTNMAISPLGVSIGESWHARWTEASQAGQLGGADVAGLDPIGSPAGQLHPLQNQLGCSADRVEQLSLSRWIGISGAAVDPGQGAATRLGTSLLMGMLNIRTGHWWDSGISAADRVGWPRLSAMRRLLYLVPRFFATQSLIIYEWIARFPGPWERFWHLSDGGYFENLAAYELIRRRVPRIVVTDCGADPSYEFQDFAELTRKVRIDFRARIESWTKNELDELQNGPLNLPAEVRNRLGTIDELLPPLDSSGATTGPASKHAALFWVHYPEIPGSKRSLLLYIKATVTGDESADIQNYLRSHPEFPHESTGDQIFDEAQWESYRKLGEHIGTGLSLEQPDNWFWKIRLPSSKAGFS